MTGHWTPHLQAESWGHWGQGEGRTHHVTWLQGHLPVRRALNLFTELTCDIWTAKNLISAMNVNTSLLAGRVRGKGGGFLNFFPLDILILVCPLVSSEFQGSAL